MADKNYTIAKTGDGSVQITFRVPFSEIQKARETAALEIGKDTEVPGFRKGNAPLEKLLNHIPQSKLFEASLSKILPQLFSNALREENLKPIAYPKFEIIKANDNEDWELMAKTAELLPFELGDYKKTALDAVNVNKIWKPGDPKEGNKTISSEEKQQLILKSLIDNIKITVPKLLIDEEVEARLSRLLEQIDKLGLTIESYLSSIGKKMEDIRGDYEKTARSSIAIDLILMAIAQKENIKIEEKDIDDAIKAASGGKEDQQFNTAENRKIVENVLLKRFALNRLTPSI